MPKTKKHPLYIDRNDTVEYIFVILSGRGNTPLNSRIIKKTVDAAMFLQSGFDIGLHITRTGHIGAYIKCGFFAFFDKPYGFNGCSAVLIHNHDCGASLGKSKGCRTANSVAAPGHQCYFACEVHNEVLV